MNRYIRSVLALLSVFSIQCYAGEWQLDANNSQISFISTKKVHVAETHQFNSIEGRLDSQGQFLVEIDLASVDTGVAVRDERMRQFLFDIAHFPTAHIQSTLNMEVIDAITPGTNARMIVEATLDLHGKTLPLEMDIIVTRLVGDKLSVVSVQPVILEVSNFELAAGVEQLREIVKLPSISHAVPVSFYLSFGLK